MIFRQFILSEGLKTITEIEAPGQKLRQSIEEIYNLYP